MVFDTSGSLLAAWPESTTGLARPMHLSRGPDGLLYVAEYLSDRVTVLDAAGRPVRRIGGVHGSPSILIDGVDIEGRSRGFFGHHPSCRIYRLHGELPGVPAREAIRRALYTHPAKRTAAASSSADG